MLVFTVTSLNGIDMMAKKVATPHLFLLQETEKHYSKFKPMIGLRRCLSAAQRLRPTTHLTTTPKKGGIKGDPKVTLKG